MKKNDLIKNIKIDLNELLTIASKHGHLEMVKYIHLQGCDIGSNND